MFARTAAEMNVMEPLCLTQARYPQKPRVTSTVSPFVLDPEFAHGHRSAAERAGGEAPQRPVGVHSELWSYEIAGGSPGRG
jgi:hypothetical protein